MTTTPTLSESLSLSQSVTASVSESLSLPTATETFSESLRTATVTASLTFTQTLSLSSSISITGTLELEELRWCDFYVGDTFISCTLLALLAVIGGLLLFFCCCCAAFFYRKRKKEVKDASYDEMLLSSDKGSNSTEKRDTSQKPPVPREVGNKSPGLDMGATFTGSVGQVNQPQQKIPGVVRVYEKGGSNEGDYVISTLSVNTLPTWKRTVPTERWIYSSPDGFWRITDTTKDFESGKGYVTSSHPHGGEPPSRSEGWYSANGQPLQINMVPEDYKLTPAKQYHSPFPVDPHPHPHPHPHQSNVMSPPPNFHDSDQFAQSQPFAASKASATQHPHHPAVNPMLPPIIPYEPPNPPQPVSHTDLYHISTYDDDIFLHDDSDSDEPDGFRRRA